MSIADNIDRIREEISRAADRASRDPREITIVAVSKTRAAQEIDEAIRAGISHIGENRVQEAAEKIPDVREDAAWHLIGHLQSNKTRKAADLFDWVDTIDSRETAEKLASWCAGSGKSMNVLIQVNVSGEEVKSGIAPEMASDFAGFVADTAPLRLRGLMTIGTFDAASDLARKEFRQMKRLFDTIRGNLAQPDFDTLSMGMSGDYALAVEEGATMVRVGSAIFGERR